MKRLFKRNQVVITFLAVMIAVAGYINYISSIDKESTKVNAGVENIDEYTDIFSNDEDVDELSLLEPGTAVMTSSDIAVTSLISEVKLNREQLRADNKETLYQIIDNQQLDEASKQNAINEMIQMTEISEKEMAAELLLEAKGFGECIVTLQENSVDVVVNATEIDEVQRTQIEDIVKRKTGVGAEQIVISPVATRANQ